MKPYFLSIGTGMIHKTSCSYRKRINSENYREFSFLEEILESTDKHMKTCKSCMKDEKENWGKILDVHK